MGCARRGAGVGNHRSIRAPLTVPVRRGVTASAARRNRPIGQGARVVRGNNRRDDSSMLRNQGSDLAVGIYRNEPAMRTRQFFAEGGQ